MLKVIISSIVLLAPAIVSAAAFNVTGTVLKVRPEALSVVIAHDDIPGFMPAMTMPFNVQDVAELEGLEPGSKVRFVFDVQDEGSWARDFEITGRRELARHSVGAAQAAVITKVREGDRAPHATLTNQDGEPTSLVDAEGRWTLMTFIFTRCPVPTFCPKMSSNLTAIQKSVKGTPVEEQLRLMSITLDPEFDTPDLLKQYGAAVGSDFSNWTYATGSKAEIDRLTSAFRVFVKENGITLDHTLCTVLISPEGVITHIWRGNAWTPGEVTEALAAQLEGVAGAAASLTSN